MGPRDLRDQVCIVGVGDTPQGAIPDKTGDELAIDASGATGCYMIQHAALLLHAGMANYILLVYGTNQKTNRNRFGEALLEEHAPYGSFNPSLPFAFAFRRHMHLYGTTEEQLATVAITQRAHAAMNPKAALRAPITLDDYMSARYIVAP